MTDEIIKFPLHPGIEVEYSIIESARKRYLNSLKEQNQDLTTFNAYDFLVGFHMGVDWLQNELKTKKDR